VLVPARIRWVELVETETKSWIQTLDNLQRSGFDTPFAKNAQGTQPPSMMRTRIYMAWMYILKCADGSYYVGSTKNLELRFEQHQSGKGSRYTSGRLPVELVYGEEYDRVADAYAREKQVQNWGRAKRKALINGDTEMLPPLAKKRFQKK
jgi:putative endonuclease